MIGTLFKNAFWSQESGILCTYAQKVKVKVKFNLLSWKKGALRQLAVSAYSENLNRSTLCSESGSVLAAACPTFLFGRGLLWTEFGLGFRAASLCSYTGCSKVSLGESGCGRRCQHTDFSFPITGSGSSFHSQQNYILPDLCFWVFFFFSVCKHF